MNVASTHSEDFTSPAHEYKRRRESLLGNLGGSPSERRHELVALTDEWLRTAYHNAGGRDSGMALVAVGGYGRRELAPGSDLDLVLVHDGSHGAAAIADALWYPIWDSGVRLDHSVRTLAELRDAAGDDLRVVLGFLDARVIEGDVTLGASARSRLLDDWRATARIRLPELRDQIDERVRRSGELAHLLEPDLKESYGGLRDLSVLRAIAASWVTDKPHDDLTAAHTFLLDVRDALHATSGRHSDVLLLQEQSDVAARLGTDADSLLRQVSASGRAIAYASDVTWHWVGRSSVSKPFARFKKPR